MAAISYLQNNFIWFLALVGLLGLLVGSFLNVVIYRLPIMLNLSKTRPFNLFFPRSHCPHCRRTIPFWQNIPVLSYLVLRGKCHFCSTAISVRYPLVELASCLLSIYVASYFGFTYQTALVLLLTWGLIALAVIDISHLILPDVIVLPLLWLGLLVSAFGFFTTPKEAIIGAVAGYLVLWLLAKAYKIVRHVDGVGYGDFKLAAMFGAWLGWHMLLLVILISSLLGAVIGITLVLLKKHSYQRPIPFGPFLAVGGWIAMLWGQGIYSWYFSLWIK